MRHGWLIIGYKLIIIIERERERKMKHIHIEESRRVSLRASFLIFA